MGKIKNLIIGATCLAAIVAAEARAWSRFDLAGYGEEVYEPKPEYRDTKFDHIKEGLPHKLPKNFLGSAIRSYYLIIKVPENYEKGPYCLWWAVDELRQLGMKEITWQKLYNWNKDVIGDNPDLIKPGMRLRIRYDGCEVSCI